MQVAHNGGVNRLRACPQLPHLLATLADTGAVHVWDVQVSLSISPPPLSTCCGKKAVGSFGTIDQDTKR
jgi:hypothetical protein